MLSDYRIETVKGIYRKIVIILTHLFDSWVNPRGEQDCDRMRETASGREKAQKRLLGRVNLIRIYKRPGLGQKECYQLTDEPDRFIVGPMVSEITSMPLSIPCL